MSHVYCPECGFQNPEASNYCSRCGALLTADAGAETTMSFDMADDGDEVDLLESLGINGPALVVRSGGGMAGQSFQPERGTDAHRTLARVRGLPRRRDRVAPARRARP